MTASRQAFSLSAMKLKQTTLAVWLTLVCCCSFESARAQVYSQNIVGYYNLVLRPGDNLLANQLEATGGNSLNNLFQASIPNGSTFSKWNAASVQFLPLSTYDASSGWSINYDLNLGEGGLFNAPTAFTNTFVGSVWSGLNTDAEKYGVADAMNRRAIPRNRSSPCRRRSGP